MRSFLTIAVSPSTSGIERREGASRSLCLLHMYSTPYNTYLCNGPHLPASLGSCLCLDEEATSGRQALIDNLFSGGTVFGWRARRGLEDLSEPTVKTRTKNSSCLSLKCK